MFKKLLSLILILLLAFSLFGCADNSIVEEPNINEVESIIEDGIYTTPEEVA